MSLHLDASPPETAADEALAVAHLSLADKPAFADLPDEVRR
jgi:hypothetical protein